MKEIWKGIPKYMGSYQVSSRGVVRGLERIGCIGRKLKGKFLHPAVDKDGYLYVQLYKKGLCKKYKIHRLVLLTFVGSCPKGQQGCHNDGDPSNNYLNNLRWDTQSSNQKDSIKHGTSWLGKRHLEKSKKKISLNHADFRGEKSVNAKLTWKKVRFMRKLYSLGKYTQVNLAKKFSVSETLISYVVNGKVWQEHLG